MRVAGGCGTDAWRIGHGRGCDAVRCGRRGAAAVCIAGFDCERVGRAVGESRDNQRRCPAGRGDGPGIGRDRVAGNGGAAVACRRSECNACLRVASGRNAYRGRTGDSRRGDGIRGGGCSTGANCIGCGDRERVGGAVGEAADGDRGTGRRAGTHDAAWG